MAGTELVFAFLDRNDEWVRIDTGVTGEFIVQNNEFVIPFENDMQADEATRIIANIFRRGRHQASQRTSDGDIVFLDENE